MCPQIEPDFSESAGLKSGQYLARISASELRKGKSSGNPYINWQLTTAGNADVGANNQVVYYNTPFTGKGAGMFKQFVEAAIGEPVAEDLNGFDTESIHGNSVIITVTESAESTWPEVKRVAAAR